MRAVTSTSKGIGFRNEHINDLIQPSEKASSLDFLELAPENWMNIGGYKQEILETIADQFPLIAHGLSLSIGDSQPLNIAFVKQVRDFLNRYNIEIYSEHLSFSQDQQGYLYDLLPIPRHQENVDYIADRIKTVQDIIQRPLVLENISYYYRYPDEMPEAEFICQIQEKSQCEILLDINNVYVNSQNHQYDPLELIYNLPGKAIRYFHIAGHLNQDNGLLLDTHGKAVNDQVMSLAQKTIQYHGQRPLLLERDHFVPELTELCDELDLVYQTINSEINTLDIAV